MSHGQDLRPGATISSYSVTLPAVHTSIVISPILQLFISVLNSRISSGTLKELGVVIEQITE